MTLTIKAGRWYRRRDGVRVGPIGRNPGAYLDTYPWRCGLRTYRADGRWVARGWHACDLISEVPAPKPKPTLRHKPKRKMMVRWCYFVQYRTARQSIAVMDYHARAEAIRERETEIRDGWKCGPVERHEFTPPTPKGKRK